MSQASRAISTSCASAIRPRDALLAVTSVDGVNVISGETAAQQQSGYVLGRVGLGADRRLAQEPGRSRHVLLHAPRRFLCRAHRPAARRRRDRRRAVSRTSPHYGPAARPGAKIARRHRRPRPKRAPRQPRMRRARRDSSRRARQRSESKLGTGHGHREASPAQYVDFQRASSTPDETIVIYYDSRKNLVAQGVLPQPQRRGIADRRPDPFPNGFVPDPVDARYSALRRPAAHLRQVLLIDLSTLNRASRSRMVFSTSAQRRRLVLDPAQRIDARDHEVAQIRD